MILQALTRLYQRLLASGVPGIAPFGYSQEKISFEIVLDNDGSVVAVNDIRDTSGKKPLPRPLSVPQPAKRTVNIRPNFLWDKTSYALGVGATSSRLTEEHGAFRELHTEALANETDPGLLALLRFLQTWQPSRFTPPLFRDEVLDANVVFRLSSDAAGNFIHQRPAAQAARMRLLQPEDASGEDGGKADTPLTDCLVTGKPGAIARLHPSIKGVNGAQSSGADIVSFNQEAFTSLGKSQGQNAPVSVEAAFAYTTALNHLLRRGEDNRQRLQIADTTVVFWAEADNPVSAANAELIFASFFETRVDDASEQDRLRRLLEGVGRGLPLAVVDPGLDPDTRLYVLGLAPNVSRLSIRFWLVDTLESLTRRQVQHFQDLRLDPLPWKNLPSAYRLVLATVPHREGARPKADDAANNLIGELIRAILTGGLYPYTLLVSTITRFRADGDLNGLRVALCKAVLARRRRLSSLNATEIPVALDVHSKEPAYLLGRLFAVLEHVQRNALGQVNSTIRDRYYGAASATPATLFPVLLRGAQNHLAKLRKDSPGQAVNLDKSVHDIIAGLPDHFPRTLDIEHQGRFAIGYYHQSQANFTSKKANKADSNDEAADSAAQPDTAEA